MLPQRICRSMLTNSSDAAQVEINFLKLCPTPHHYRSDFLKVKENNIGLKKYVQCNRSWKPDIRCEENERMRKGKGR